MASRMPAGADGSGFVHRYTRSFRRIHATAADFSEKPFLIVRPVRSSKTNHVPSGAKLQFHIGVTPSSGGVARLKAW